MIIGYARVSTKDQSLNMQLDALKKAGCERIYQEKVSGAKDEREQLNLALQMLRPGDKTSALRLLTSQNREDSQESSRTRDDTKGFTTIQNYTVLKQGLKSSQKVGGLAFILFV